MKKSKKIIYAVIAVILTAMSIMIIYHHKTIISVYHAYKQIKGWQTEYANGLKNQESQFKEKPDPCKAFILASTYYYPSYKTLKDDDKALYYAKASIELGAEKHEYLRARVNFLIALIYHEKKEKNLARYYLKRAFDLDREDLFRKENVREKYGLQDIWDKEWDKKGQ